MNWSALFAGAPQGFQSGMNWGQQFQQNQQMNPLLLQQQQLQNKQLGQNISQSGTGFNQQQSMLDALTRMGLGGGGQPGAIPGGVPPGMAPTAQPMGQFTGQGPGQGPTGAMPNLDEILAGSQANVIPQALQNLFSNPQALQSLQGLFGNPQSYGDYQGGGQQPFNQGTPNPLMEFNRLLGVQ